MLTAKDSIAQDAKVSLTGTGHTAVHAEKTLNVSLKGVGTVEYSGKPEVTQDIQGIGKVIGMD